MLLSTSRTGHDRGYVRAVAIATCRPPSLRPGTLWPAVAAPVEDPRRGSRPSVVRGEQSRSVGAGTSGSGPPPQLCSQVYLTFFFIFFQTLARLIPTTLLIPWKHFCFTRLYFQTPEQSQKYLKKFKKKQTLLFTLKASSTSSRWLEGFSDKRCSDLLWSRVMLWNRSFNCSTYCLWIWKNK